MLIRSLIRQYGVPMLPSEPDETIAIRSTQAKFVDLTTALSAIHDTNRVTVSVTSVDESLSAKVWLGKTLTDGMSAAMVKRVLLDNFWVEASGATSGQVSGTLYVQGRSGANGTGALLTYAIQFDCDDEPASIACNFGALTHPGFGGPALHEDFPTTHETLTISTQTNTNQFTLRRATDDSMTRLVLKGTPPTTYTSPMNPPTVAPVAGESATVTLSNGVSYVISFIADQFDVAPWSVASTHDVGGTNTACAADNQAAPNNGTQLQLTTRYGPKARGQTIMLKKGVYNPSTGTMNMYFGQTFGSSGVTFGTGAGIPDAPFDNDGDGWDYSPLPTYHPGWIKIQSEEPLGAVLDGTVGWYLQYMTSAEPLGIRITGNKFTKFTTCVVNSPSEMLMFDHCWFERTDGLGSPCVTMGADTTNQRNKNFFIANYVNGNVNICGLDSKIIGNRMTSEPPIQDLLNWTLADSNPAAPKSEIAFNLFIDKKGLVSAEHEDITQFRGLGGFFSSTSGNTHLCRFYGNIIWRGEGALNGSDELTGGQCIFIHDVHNGMKADIDIVGNIVCEISQHGITLSEPGAVNIKRNILIQDPAVAVAGLPWIRFRHYEYGTTIDGSAIEIESNIISDDAPIYLAPAAGVYPDLGVGEISPQGTNTGNYWNEIGAQLSTRFVNPTLGSGAQDVADIVVALQFNSGQEVDAGPLYDLSIIDLERQTVNWTALVA